MNGHGDKHAMRPDDIEYVPVSRPTRLSGSTDDSPAVRAEMVSGCHRFKVIDCGDIVLDLNMVEALNLAIELIEKAGTAGANAAQAPA
jgi:hypothetical protein